MLPFLLFPMAVSVGVFSLLGAADISGVSRLIQPDLIGVAIIVVAFGFVNRKFSKMSGARGGLYWVGASAIVLVLPMLAVVWQGLAKAIAWNWLWY
jgi:hypothetical protein